MLSRRSFLGALTTTLVAAGLDLGGAFPQRVGELTVFRLDRVNEVDGHPLVGARPTARVSKDGGAFTATTYPPEEHGKGLYIVPLTAAECDGDLIHIEMHADGAFTTGITYAPMPKTYTI